MLPHYDFGADARTEILTDLARDPDCHGRHAISMQDLGSTTPSSGLPDFRLCPLSRDSS